MIELSIDGKKIQVSEGVTVLRAAQQAGIHIPNLCDHPAVTPYGGCRLCVVEVEGMRLPTASCTLPAANGMVIHTDTEALRETRRFILSMLFSERNHFCPFCQVSGGDCELQNAAYHEGMTHWPIQPNWKVFPVDTSHPTIILDNNRCILCRRCVRACEELVGNATLAIEARGSDSMLIADTGIPLGESTCISCGTCIQVCPTGALIDKDSAYLGQEAHLTRTASICVGCSVGCGIQVLSRDGHLVRIEGDWLAPVNQGVLCEVGRFSALHRQEIRLNSPLIRQDGQLKAVSWEQALDYAASQLKPLIGQTNGGLAALISTRLSLEDISAFEDFFRNGFGSDMLTSIEEGFTLLSEEIRQGAAELPFEGKLADLKQADGVLIIGANLSDYHQVIGFLIRRQTIRGNQLVVIDPKENPLDETTPHVLRSQTNQDAATLRELAQAVTSLSQAKTQTNHQGITGHNGIPTEKILAAARALAGCKKVAIVFGKGITTQNDPDILAAMRELSQALGANSGTPAAMISVKGKANSLGADQLKLDQPFHLDGRKAAYIVLGDDSLSKRQLRALQGVPLLIVQAAYQSKLTEIADVVFPVSTWSETAGHYLNLEGRLQQTQQILELPANVHTNGEVLQTLAARLGIRIQANWRERLLQSPAVVSLDLDKIEN